MSRAELLLLDFRCVAHFIVLGSSMQVLTDATDFHRCILCTSLPCRQAGVKSVRAKLTVTYEETVYQKNLN